MRKLVIKIKASTHEINLDDYYEADEEINSDDLYDYHIHEVVSQPDYETVVVDEDGNKIEID